MPPTRRRAGRRAALAGLGLAAAALLLPGAALASPAGDLDQSFDRDGRRLLLSVKTAADVLVQDDGKALVVGESSNGEFRVVRLTSEGAPDPGFGTDGVAVADLGGEDRALAGALQPDGKIVVAGESVAQNSVRPAVAGISQELGVPVARLQADPPPVQDPGTGGGSGGDDAGSGGGGPVADRDAPVIGRRALARGRYRLTVRATDAAANRSAAQSRTFRVVR